LLFTSVKHVDVSIIAKKTNMSSIPASKKTQHIDDSNKVQFIHCSFKRISVWQEQ
jgi:hypothetical protein